MTWEAWVTCGIVVLVLWSLARGVAGPDVILTGGALMLVTLSLTSTRFPGIGDLSASFGNEGVLTVAVLYVVAAGLTETGGMRLLTERLLGRPRTVVAAQFRLSVPAGLISAFINNTPVVAMLIPVVSDWCKKTGLSPSKLFIPLSYVTILGGMCTLIGTSTNLVVHGLMVSARRTDPEMPLMSMFTLTPVGVSCAVTGVLFILIASRWLLPERIALREEIGDARQYTVEMRVARGSAVEGLTIESAGLRHLPGAYLSAIERNGEVLIAVGPEQVLHADDRLVFVGILESVIDLQRIRGLLPATNQVAKLTAAPLDHLLVEAVVSDANPLVGQSIRNGRFRTRYDAAVIAVYRNGERLGGKIGDIVLKSGDTLLLQSAAGFTSRHRNSRDFLLVSAVDESRPVRHDRAFAAMALVLGMVLLAAFESRTNVSIFHAALLAAASMGVAGCISAHQARRSLDLPVLVAIAASLVIGQGVARSGLAAACADVMIQVSGGYGPWAALAGVYVLTVLFTEVVTNNAAAALVFPIAVATAHGLGVSFMPFAVAVAIGASAGFATPLGYQTHLMVYGPGGYRFSDFVRIGLPLDILCGVVTVTMTPLVYPF
jgi:di/tricarboxylate transporter